MSIWRRVGGIVAIVVAVTVIGVMGACTDKFTGPKRLVADSTRLHADSTLARDWNQPQDMTAQLTAAPSNGGGETDQSLGDFPVDSKIMLIATGYVVRTDNYIPEGSANLGPGQSVGVIRRHVDGTTESLTFPNNGGQIADTQLVTMSHGQSLIKVVRIGENPLTRNNVLWNGQYINCSPTSSPPCLSYSGGHTIQVVTKPASYTAAADSSMYSLWSTAEFRLTASPDTIFGGNVPMQIDSAIWTPAPDSVGGNSDPSDSASVMGCGGLGYVTNQPPKTIYHCTRFIRGAGTMTFIAHANGFRQQSQPVQINVRDKRLTLIASRSAVHAGDTVKFTPFWSDGTTVSPQWWQWFPDSGTNQIGGDCAHTASTCTKAIPQSGTMKVWVWQNTNLKRAASAHVTVYTTFDVVADKETAYPGDTVTFTARLDQKPAVAKSWRWAPTDTSQHDGTACAQVKTCPKVMVGSGTMKAWLGDTASSDSAAKTIIVLPPPRLQLAVAPGSVQLGQSATFTASASGASFTINRWSFQGRAPCGSATQCSYAPPFTGTMWAFGTVRGVVDSASAGIAVTLAANDSTTVGTDSSAILRIKWSPGISGSPAAGAYVYPKGSDVHYQFATTGPYTGLVTVLDDTLLVPSDTTLHLNTDRSVEAAADRDFSNDDEVTALRNRLHTLVKVAPSAEKYRQHIIWYADSARASLRAPDSLDIKLEAASLLEFDPYVDRGALLAYDAILSGYVFEYSKVGSQSSVTTLSPETYAPDLVSARRPLTSAPSLSRIAVPGRPSKTNNSVHISAGTKLVYINGIRTSLGNVTDEGGTLTWLYQLVEGDAQLQSLNTTYFYNRNLEAQLAAYDSASGCAGMATRGNRIWHPLTSRIRYFRCKFGEFVRIVKENDYVEAASQYAQIILHIAGSPPADVGTLAARLTSWYHDSTYDVILITHSQGNMVASQAMQMVLDQEQALNTVFCTSEMALASPVPSGSFSPLTSDYVDGLTINNDVLFMFGAQNGFPRADTDTSLVGADSIAAASFIRKPLVRLNWGIRIHEVNWNYLRYPNSVGTLQTALERLYAKCEAINNTP